MLTRWGVVLCCCLVLAAPVQGAPAADPRPQFQEAQQALARGDLRRFTRLSEELEDYVLYPYLEYTFMRRYISSRVDQARVKAFLERWPDTPLADRLRDAWLAKLAQRGQWDQFLELWEPARGDTELSCLAGRAMLARERREEAFVQAQRLWLVGKSQPKACDPLFAAWIAADGVSEAIARERIDLAMAAGSAGLTRYLEQFLPAAERHWLALWRRVYGNPSRELERLAANGSGWPGQIFVSGVRRLAGYRPEAADEIWRRRADEFDLDRHQRDEAERSIALGLAWDRHPLAHTRLSALAPEAHTAKSRQWRVRIALWQEDWAAVVAALDALDPLERAEPDWVYWRARAVEAGGDPDGAAELYREAAQCRCFYGFLAAERIGIPPTIETVPLAVSDEELSLLADLPAMQRARELFAVGMEVDARREWRHATAGMPAERLRTAAKLADRWGWHDQAILTLGRTEFLQDLELRFPTPYTEVVSAEAERRELDNAFIYAVMRQESAFYANARSPVGALGLMQLMPATAKLTGRQIRQPVKGTWDILEVDNNIRLGTAHLRHLLDRYRGNRLYTAAAYNAGPHRVDRWLPAERELAGDIWVASMPFDETREYVKRIFAYTVIYEWRLGREPTPVSTHLPTVSPPGERTRITGDGAASAG